MKALDHLYIGHDRAGGLSMHELVTFVDKYRAEDVSLVYNYSRSDHESAVWDVVKNDSMSNHPALKIEPDDRWVKAENDKKYARTKSESIEQWRRRFDVMVHDAGYYVDNKGTPHWIFFAPGEVIVCKAGLRKTDKSEARYFDGTDHFMIYPYVKEAEL